MQEISLNIGAGKTKIPGFINIDLFEKADLPLDLSKDALPFETGSVGLVFSYHTLEHMTNYLFCLSEIYRVLKHGGVFFVGVPYVTLTEYHLINPYHKINFNEYSFDFFDPEKLKGSAAEKTPIMFKKIFHRFHYKGRFRYLPPFIQDGCRKHLLNVVNDIDFGLLAVKIHSSPPLISAEVKKQWIQKFDLLLSKRVTY